MSTYFDDIKDGIRSTIKGLSLTFGHIRNATKRRQPLGIASDNYFEQQNGLVTVQYPHETIPIPDNGRYRLHNEIDDCIVCDKCAKVCPVDCITIEAIKATEEIGRASDGSPIRLYAGKFDIDMAKCCYCGLCTVVCPTECLTMEKKFDYSEFELGKLTYEFSNLTPDEAAEKRSLYEQFVLEKEQAKQQAKERKSERAEERAEPKPAEPTPTAQEKSEPAKPKPAFRPTLKPKPATALTKYADEAVPVAGIQSPESPALLTTDKGVSTSGEDHPAAQADNTVQPTEDKERESERAKERVAPKPAFRPTMKPKAAAEPTQNTEPQNTATTQNTEQPEPAKPKPAFRPTMKPKAAAEPTRNTEQQNTATSQNTEQPEPAKPKPAFRPTMKPKAAAEPTRNAESSEPAKPKPDTNA